MGLDVSVALIGTPDKGDTVLIGLEDGRSMSLSFGTTISSNQWEILSPTDLPEVNRAYEQSGKDALAVAGDLTCVVSSGEVIAVGRSLGVYVTSRVMSESKSTWTNLDSPIATISVL